MDPITLEILKGKLLSTVDEMGVVLARTSMSPVIYEVLDFACGLCDSEGNLISQTNGITVFTGTFSTQVKFIKEKFNKSISEGDIFLTNDPFKGGTHACDFAIIKPIFLKKKIIAFAISVAHWIDVGGAIAGSLPPDSDIIYKEGIRFSGVRLCKENILIDDIVSIILENVRFPKLAMGDLNAQLASVRIAKNRLKEIYIKYGGNTLNKAFKQILSDSERQSRKIISYLPDGIYKAKDWIDGDGTVDDQIFVQVKVIIKGTNITFDYTGCSSSRSAPINCSYGALTSAVKTVFKALVEPYAPSNEGYFRPMKVVVPKNTVFSATKPTATGWYYEGTAQASELAWKALAPLALNKFSAGSYMSLCAIYICGKNINNQYVHIEPQNGGWGATFNRDGANAMISITDGDTYNYSIELLEAKFPLQLIQYSLNTKDGLGHGKYRGGLGCIREYKILDKDSILYASLGRSKEPPWGMNGGKKGTCNYIIIKRGKQRIKISRVPYFVLQKNDRVEIVTGCGGGYGNPKLRDISLIKGDLMNGFL
ncbi:MAG: hydantoinase B/oxoprolinase family protein, partial [SAR202 cluster bacterium]|nr:hydantoinase B/oxoprolinase family protein [SAR202 cluster bacterium]